MSSTIDRLALYERRRKVGLDFNGVLVNRYVIDRPVVLDRAAQQLTDAYRRPLSFEHDPDASTLMDYALHDVPYHGKNAIQWAIDEKVAGNEEEESILQALSQARLYLTKVVEADRTEALVRLQ